MKKQKSKNKRNRRNTTKVTKNKEENSVEFFYRGFIPLGMHGVLWLFICTFMVFFISYQLNIAATTLTILHLRSASSFSYSEFPLWFIFVVLFNIALWLLSVGYVWYYVKLRLIKKNA